MGRSGGRTTGSGVVHEVGETRRGWAIRLAICLALVAGLTAGGPPAGAEEGTGAEPRIVGGTQAAPGAWPSQVALLTASQPDNYHAQFCGGTLIDHSWVLTAAHCVFRPTSQTTYRQLAASEIDVLAGTQRLSAGGDRIDVAQIKVHPSYDPLDYHDDVALLRLTRPSSINVPLQALVAPGVAPAVGTDVTTTGWGTTQAGQPYRPDDLRQVTVDVQPAGTCTEFYGGDFVASKMTCAGNFGYDSCQGDSGGPLVQPDGGGGWTQVGIVSWGGTCASYPGVYVRLGTYRGYVDGAVRFGPHGDSGAFVRRTYLDLFDRQPTSTELFNAASDLNDGNPSIGQYLSSLVQGSAYQSKTGGVTRLYRAFFLRPPDTPGLQYWWDGVNNGRSLHRIANIMASSAEFIERYGNLTNADYVDRVYQNVLGRPADPDGKAHWVGELESGKRTRGQVMVGFSESSEYKGQWKATNDVIITFFAALHRVPTAAELTNWIGSSNVSLATSLLRSRSYHARI